MNKTKRCLSAVGLPSTALCLCFFTCKKNKNRFSHSFIQTSFYFNLFIYHVFCCCFFFFFYLSFFSIYILLFKAIIFIYCSIARKLVFRVSFQVQHKPVGTVTEDGLKFQLQKIDGLYHRCSKNKDADQLCVCPAADLYLHFFVYKNIFFLMIIEFCRFVFLDEG